MKFVKNFKWGYYCDRCEELTGFWNWLLHRKGKFRYCQKCWNWIHLIRWTDKEGNHHTLRSERR